MKIYDLEEMAIVLKPGDDVAVAKEPLNAGLILGYDGQKIRVNQDVNAGHKLALHAIRRDNPIRKYGQIIGFATDDISAGGKMELPASASCPRIVWPLGMFPPSNREQLLPPADIWEPLHRPEHPDVQIRQRRL